MIFNLSYMKSMPKMSKSTDRIEDNFVRVSFCTSMCQQLLISLISWPAVLNLNIKKVTPKKSNSTPPKSPYQNLSPKKSPYQNLSPKKSHYKISNPKKVLRSQISNPKKGFAHPRHLYTRVPPLG